MLALIQLVKNANVVINDHPVAAIGTGILALIGIEKTDTFDTATKLLEKILHYRIFPDENGKTNLSLEDIRGGLLLVPQFTLVADTSKGLRPGFSLGMSPVEGKSLFEKLVAHAQQVYSSVSAGEFGAYMQVNLCNDGPMTFILRG